MGVYKVSGESPGGRRWRPTTVAEKLTRLSEVMHPPGQPPMTSRALQERILEAGGTISAAYISELRSGRKTKPSLEHVQWLAKGFGVSAGYFTDDEIAERIDQQLDRLEDEQRHAELQDLALRTAGLVDEVDPGDRAELRRLVRDELARRHQADVEAESDAREQAPRAGSERAEGR